MTNPLRQLTLDQLRRRTTEKWRAYPADVLPLFVAEMDVPLAEPIVRAVSNALELGDSGYPAGTGYADALADFARKRWGWDGVVAERTRVVPDVMFGLAEALRLVGRDGDPVVVNSPVYPPFYDLIRHLGRQVVESPLGADGRLDLEGLATTFEQHEHAAYLLCNPQNPTGTVHTREELEAVATIAGEHGVRVVVDEIHAPLVLPGADFVPYLSISGTADAFSAISASKGWNLAGLKAALLSGGNDTVAELASLPLLVTDGASHIGIHAHVAALRDGGDWLDALVAGLDDNRRLLGTLLAESLPSVRYRPPAATYLAWLDCRELDLGDDPAAVFLDRGRVALNSGPDFGTGGAGHVRLNLATSPEIVTEAVRRIAVSLG
ncbi:MalY/PatB family protein [Fodinicola acaciae]|uniref:MalY/PatB family protein n=1 Tax=Fodinicola acaciae TaxID=2681555 RepID=UPI0013D2C361|nr:aminotransferase class I/II-fold pyridoxal phosphate-dependent enzyme [Fodinicola acaciae]